MVNPSSWDRHAFDEFVETLPILRRSRRQDSFGKVIYLATEHETRETKIPFRKENQPEPSISSS